MEIDEILAEVEFMVVKVEAGIKCWEKTKEKDCHSFIRGLCNCKSFKKLFFSRRK